MFPVGLMSKNQINLNGNNAYTDSYDSSDPMKSSNGMYDPGKKQPHGDVASNSVLVDSIGIGNADIYGKVATGPGGSVTIGPNGSVGATFDESQRATTVSAGIADGWIRSDFSVDMPDPSLPSGAMFWPSLGAINNTSTISGGGWQASSINMSGNRTLTISGNVTLYVTGSTSTSGNGSIVILPGASLTIYSAGSVSIAGNGIVNNANYPVNDVIYGLSTCASVSVSGNGAFVGAIYAPEAALGIGGNGSVYGAVVASSITLSGNANFHYDESLKNLTAGSYYQVASWQELRNVNGVWQ
jgi:hypothetical protein